MNRKNHFPVVLNCNVPSGSTLPLRILLVCLGLFLVSAIAAPAYSARKYSSATNTGGPIYKYLIHQNTGGPLACGSNLVAIYVGSRTGDTQKDVATALKSLFASGKQSGGLYNPLSDSKLRVRRVETISGSQNIRVYLGGKLVRPKTFCDTAQARAMVWATAQQFPEVRHATIWLGGGLLGDLLAATERAKDK